MSKTKKGKRLKSKRAPRVATPAPPAPGLVTARTVREHLGDVSDRTFERWLAEGLPVARREPGKPSLFKLAEVDAWKAERDGDLADDERFLYGAGNSPMLEALRKEKLREIRFRNDLREGQLVETDSVSLKLCQVFAAFRTELEALERTHGRTVGDAIREMVERAKRACSEILPNGNGVGQLAAGGGESRA